MRCLLSLLFFATCSPAIAQDTLSLFYATGKHRLTEQHRVQIDAFLQRDLAEVDSVQIIGVADSVGNVTANYKLSIRRATAVHDHAGVYLKDLPVRLLAKGEEGAFEEWIYRRVDIVLFFAQDEEATQEKEVRVDDGSCYIIADTFLMGCRQTVFHKGKRTFVQLEMESQYFNPDVKLYSVSEDPETHTPILKPLRWKVAMSGKSWWKKKRYVTKINQSDFDRFRLVMKSDRPCDSTPCGFRLSDKDVHFDEKTYLLPDAFLMENLHYRRKFFNPKKVVLEVPKMYVDPTVKYYYRTGGTTPEIKWRTRRGRKRRDYFYATLQFPSKNNQQIAVLREYSGACLLADWKGRLPINCISPHEVPSLSGGLEIGDRNVRRTHYGYIGPYFRMGNETYELSLLTAIDTETEPLLSMRFDVYFFGTRNGFGKGSARPETFNAYAGTTLNCIFGQAGRQLDQDLHLGVDFIGEKFPRIFLEAGLMDVYTETGLQLQTQFRLGVRLRW